MVARMKIGASFTCVSSFASPASLRKNSNSMLLNTRLTMPGKHHLNVEQLRSIKARKPLQLIHGKSLAKEASSKVLLATSEDQESFDDDYELSDFEEEEEEGVVQPLPDNNDKTSIDSFHQVEGAEGKPGFVSFYGHKPVIKDESRANNVKGQKNRLLWFVCPTVLVASFVFPSLYLRRLLSTIFEDSLLTDFLILFFTEALFYCGVVVTLYLSDRLHRPIEPIPSQPTSRGLNPQLSHRVSSVTILALSLTIPMVTMGFVWPWTGPAASATLAPYLVGIIVQFAFERYARYKKSPSWPAIPIIFHVYRLHQLNRAAQLVTALSFTVRGAEMTSHNAAINGSLSTLLNVLQFLGVVCIWSLSSFVVRFLPSTSGVD